jgi:hypothetical protein
VDVEDIARSTRPGGSSHRPRRPLLPTVTALYGEVVRRDDAGFNPSTPRRAPRDGPCALPVEFEFPPEQWCDPLVDALAEVGDLADTGWMLDMPHPNPTTAFRVTADVAGGLWHRLHVRPCPAASGFLKASRTRPPTPNVRSRRHSSCRCSGRVPDNIGMSFIVGGSARSCVQPRVCRSHRCAAYLRGSQGAALDAVYVLIAAVIGFLLRRFVRPDRICRDAARPPRARRSPR